MANMSIKKIKFFTDYINFLMSTGTSQNNNFDIMSGSNLISSLNAGSEVELFDMKPLNQVHFETSSNRADHVLINIDLKDTLFTCDYIAILNHNMKSADSMVRVGHNDTESTITAIDMGSATAIASVSEVVNADVISGGTVTPATDGSTVFTFTPSDDQYWGIQFEGTDSNQFDSTYDLKIGCIMIGESFTLGSPDLTVKRTIIYDGVNVQESFGGQRYGNATHLGRKTINARSKAPFLSGTTERTNYTGRMIYDFSFSYLDETKLMPAEYHKEDADQDTVVSDVWNRTKGNLIPMIISTDSTDTGDLAEQSMLFCRFGENSLEMSQVLHKTYSVNMKIEEEV